MAKTIILIGSSNIIILVFTRNEYNCLLIYIHLTTFYLYLLQLLHSISLLSRFIQR